MLHANFMDLCFTEPELLPIEVLHCGNSDFRPFCSCDLDLDPMTFIYELDSYSLEIYQMCEYELHTSRLSKLTDIHTDRQTSRRDRNYIPHRFAGGQKSKRNTYKAPVVSTPYPVVICTFSSASETGRPTKKYAAPCVWHT